MKNLNDDLQPQSPRPTDASVPRPPRRRRLNPARAIGVLAGIALLALGLFALSAYQAWQRPLPLAHRTVTVTSALQIPQGTREVVYGPGSSATSGDPSHVTLPTNEVYVGAPVEISAMADVPLSLHLPPQAVIVGPAGPTIAFDQSLIGSKSELSWRASVPATAVPSVTAPLAGETFASWYVSFSQPGKVTIPVTIGSTTETATIGVLPLPPGGRVHATMTPPASLHPQLSAINVGSTPLQVALNGQRVTLSPGATQTITPGSAYTVAVSAFAGGNLAVDIFQAHGSVAYSGTLTTHRTVAYTPPHPPFALPLWFLIALIVALLTLVASTVASARGGNKARSAKSA